MKTDTVAKWIRLVLPYGLVAAIIVGVLLAFIIGQPKLIELGMAILGIPLLTTSVYLYRFNSQAEHPSGGAWNHSLGKIFLIVYFLTVAGIVQASDRGLWFFIAIGILLAVLALNALSSSSGNWIPVVESCAVIVLVAWSVTLQLPFYYAGTDIMPHLSIIEYVISTGKMIPNTVSVYGNFPLYHFYVTIYILLSDLLPKTGLFVLTGILFALTPFLVYSIVLRIVTDRRLATTASVMYAALPVTLYSSTYVVTRTFAYIGALVILYTFITRDEHGLKREAGILIFALPFLVVVHHVTVLQYMLIFGIIAVLDYGSENSGNHISILELLLVGVTFVAYWIFNSIDFVGGILLYKVFGTYAAPTFSGVDIEIQTFHATEILNNWLIVALLFIGIGSGLRSDRSRAVVYSILALICSMFLTYSPVHAFGRLQSLRFSRLMLFLSPITALCLAFALDDIRGRLSWTRPTLRVTVSVVLVVLLGATSATGGLYYDAAADSSQVTWQTPPEHFDDSELAALEHTRTIPSGSPVFSDYDSYRYLNTMLADGRLISGGRAIHETGIISNPRQPDPGYLVVRQDQLHETGIPFGTRQSVFEWSGNIITGKENNIYTNGGETIVTKNSTHPGTS